MGFFACDLFIPKTVVFLGPLHLNLARAHGIKCALHTDGADIDMANDDGHKDKADDRVPKLRKLHFGMRAEISRQFAKAKRLG